MPARVVLPQPLGPSTHTNSCSATPNDRLSSTSSPAQPARVCWKNSFVRPWTASALEVCVAVEDSSCKLDPLDVVLFGNELVGGVASMAGWADARLHSRDAESGAEPGALTPGVLLGRLDHRLAVQGSGRGDRRRYDRGVRVGLGRLDAGHR